MQGRARTSSQERHGSSQKVSDTKHVSFVESKQYQTNSNAGMLFPLKELARRTSASKSKAALRMHLGGGTRNANSASGAAAPRSLGQDPASDLSLQDAPLQTIPDRFGRAEPRMAVAEDGDDDDFEVVLSRLVRSDELLDVRRRLLQLESQLADAIDKEDYTAAARLRDEARELCSKDPEALMSSLSAQLDSAVKAERYTQAAKYASQVRLLKRRFVQEYRLAGRWVVRSKHNTIPNRDVLGGWSQMGNSVDMAYDGDTLMAIGMDGEVIFTTNVSQPLRSNEGPELEFQIGSQQALKSEGMRFFRGEGMVPSGDSVSGQLYWINDVLIGFWWPLGGVAGGGRGGGSGDRVGEEHGSFVVFFKVAELNEDDAKYLPDLSKPLEEKLEAKRAELEAQRAELEAKRAALEFTFAAGSTTGYRSAPAADNAAEPTAASLCAVVAKEGAERSGDRMEGLCEAIVAAWKRDQAPRRSEFQWFCALLLAMF